MEQLEARKKTIEQEFETFTTQRDELNVKLTKLQGAYAEILWFIKQIKEQEPVPAEGEVL